MKSYFADIPTMAGIAKCESGYRQFDGSGAVLFDPSYSMIGVFQINSTHLPESLTMGKDIMTLEGNIQYARHLYEVNGIDPWMSSFNCWGVNKTGAASPGSIPSTTTPSTTQTSIVPSGTISFGMTSSGVLTLQQMLNQTGFVIASVGAGSPGQETTKYGSLTRDAVRRFQCAQNIVCSGDESTTGYGMVDARTYQALTQVFHAKTTSLTPVSGSLDKAAEIAQVESQISSLTGQLDLLNQRLRELTR